MIVFVHGINNHSICKLLTNNDNFLNYGQAHHTTSILFLHKVNIMIGNRLCDVKEEWLMHYVATLKQFVIIHQVLPK